MLAAGIRAILLGVPLVVNLASGLFLQASNSHGSISPNITEAAASSSNPNITSAATSNPTFSPGHSTTTTVLLNTSVDDDDVAVAFANNTIDDTDSQNWFDGDWSVVPSDQAYGGSYRITNDPSAFVSFTFNGSAVYLLISHWTCDVVLYISLDYQPDSRLDLQDHSTPITAKCVPMAPPQAFRIATGLSNTTHTLKIGIAPDAVFAIFDGLVYTSVQAQGDKPTPTSGDIPMSSSSTAPTASPGPTPSSLNHTELNIKLIAGIVPSIVALVGAFLGYRKWGAKLRCRGVGVQISVDVSPSTDNQDASTDEQDVPTTTGHRPGRRPGRRRRHRPGHGDSGATSRGLVIPQAQNVSSPSASL